MSRWIDIGPKWTTETMYNVREFLKENRIPVRMPCDEIFFRSMYHLPHGNWVWGIEVRRKDLACALERLEKEGFITAVGSGYNAINKRGSS